MRHALAIVSFLVFLRCGAAAELDLVDTAAQSPDFGTLVTAIQTAGLSETLKSSGPFTVFAPTNEAFAKLPAGTVDELLKPANRERLRRILSYHVVPGRFPSSVVAQLNGRNVPTLEGSFAPVAVNGPTVKLGDASVVQADIAATNGVIHVIDTVLIPPETPSLDAFSALPAPTLPTVRFHAASAGVSFSPPFWSTSSVSAAASCLPHDGWAIGRWSAPCGACAGGTVSCFARSCRCGW